MSNLFKALKPSANLGHSVFDLSQKHVFSSKTGAATPCLFVETVPDDHFQIKCASLHRTMRMNTAAFVRGKFRYDFFFVPYSQLWHPFNQFIDQRKDKHSTNQYGFANTPIFSLGYLLGFGLNSFRAFHWNQPNVHTLDCDMFGQPFIFGLIRLLDLCGYGNYQPILKPCYPTNPDTGAAWAGTERDDAFTAAMAYAASFNTKYCNLFRIAAYQHVWYDYYRNKYYDENFQWPSIVDYEYINAFNFDDIRCTSFSQSYVGIPYIPYSNPLSDWEIPDALRIFQIFSQRYVQWKKDLFTSSMPGTQFGSVSTVDIGGVTSDDFERWHDKNSSTLTGNTAVVTGSGSNANSLDAQGVAAIRHDHAYSTSFDVLALKRAEALQAWKQNTLRAGNMVDDNFKAHFGVKPRYESDNNVAFLGSYEAVLEVNSVTALADTGGSINGNVGDLAATGVASLHGDVINYDAKDFGCIVCISTFVPESEYNNNMIDKANRLYEPFDFFTAEYQNIGLEPVQGVDLDANLFVNSENKVLGYAPRYWMYKTALDKVHGEFTRVPYQIPNQYIESINGTLRAWVVPRNEFLIASGFDSDGYHILNRAVGSFYVNPVTTDTIFGITTTGFQNTDPYLNNVYFDIKAVRPMSVLGLPQF